MYEQAAREGTWQGDSVLTLTELRHLHRLVVEQVWAQSPPVELHPAEGPGSFRHHEIAMFSGGMQPPTFVTIPALVDDWLKVVQSGPRDDEHLMEHLASAHVRFESIHPFRDGNGRTGRLVMNLMLVRRGYPPAIIYNRDRPKYIASLIQADRRGNIGPLAALIARSVKDGIDRFLLPELAGPQRMVPLSALMRQDLSGPALRLAAERGRLRAQRRGTRWYSTKKWVDEYLKSRYQRRPKGE